MINNFKDLSMVTSYMIEIDLYLDGKSAFEYTTTHVPRVGELLDISHEDVMGEFKVTNVTHTIHQRRESHKIVGYVKIDAIRVTT